MISCRAFRVLSSRAMVPAAHNFYAALRPSGACILDTIKVQGDRRTLTENSLIAAGFCVLFQKSERWCREQLDPTGIVYGMTNGRPHIPTQDQYPTEGLLSSQNSISTSSILSASSTSPPSGGGR